MRLSERAPIILAAALCRRLDWGSENDASKWIADWCAARALLFDYPGHEDFKYPSGEEALADLEQRLGEADLGDEDSVVETTALDAVEQSLASQGTWLCRTYSGPDDPRHDALAAAGLV